jgi:ferredoxin
MRLRDHVLAALQGIASERWHGRGCRRRNCGSVCLCAPCHARVALEKMGQCPQLEMTAAALPMPRA